MKLTVMHNKRRHIEIGNSKEGFENRHGLDHNLTKWRHGARIWNINAWKGKPKLEDPGD
jgi:hypothetical protein